MPETKQVITGDSASAQKAYADLARQVTKLEEAIQRVGTKTEQSMRRGAQGQSALNGLWQRGISSLVSTAAAWVTIDNIIRLVNRDIEANIALMDRSKAAQVTLGESQAELVLNTWKMPAEEFKNFQKQLQTISRQTGVQPATITKAASAMYATSQGDPAHKAEVLDLAARLGFQNASQIPTMAVAIERIASATGKTPKEAAALVLSGGAAAFIADPEKQAEYLGQATSGIMASSNPANRSKAAEQAVEFTAGFTQVVGEDKGQKSRTQAIALSSDMQEFFERGVDVTFPGRSRSFRHKPKEDPGYAMDRMRYLQEHPNEAKYFEQYGMKHAEAMFKPAIQRIIGQPDSPEAKTFFKAESIVEYDAAEVDRQLQRLNQGSDPLITSAAQKKSSALQESVAAENTAGAQKSVTRESVLNALKNTNEYNYRPYGMKWTADWAVQSEFAEQQVSPLTAMSDEDIARSALRKRENEILDDWWGKKADPEKLSGRRKDAYEAVHGQLEILNEMRAAREATEAQTKVLEQIRDQRPDKVPSAAPAARQERGRHKER